MSYSRNVLGGIESLTPAQKSKETATRGKRVSFSRTGLSVHKELVASSIEDEGFSSYVSEDLFYSVVNRERPPRSGWKGSRRVPESVVERHRFRESPPSRVFEAVVNYFSRNHETLLSKWYFRVVSDSELMKVCHADWKRSLHDCLCFPELMRSVTSHLLMLPQSLLETLSRVPSALRKLCDLIDLLDDKVKLFSDLPFRSIFSMLICAFSVIKGVVERDLCATISNIALMLLNDLVASKDFLKDFLVSMQNSLYSVIPQADAEVVSPNVLVAFAKLVAQAGSSFLFGKIAPSIQKAVTSTKDYAFDIGNEISFLESIFAFYKRCVSSIDKFRQTGSIWDLFGSDSTNREITMMNDMINELVSPDIGILIDNASRLVEIRAFQKSCSKRVGPVKNAVYTATYMAFSDALLQFSRRNAISRREPVSFILTGPPGAGKTTFIHVFQRMMKKKLGLPDDCEIAVTIQPTKHQTVPPVSLMVVVNDALQTKDEYCDTPNLSMLQSFADTAPMKLETASIAEKENSIISPEVVFFSTNAEKFEFTKSTGGVSKIVRRYLIIEFGYTTKAVELAKKNNIDVSLVLAKFGEKEDGLITVTFGRLNSKAVIGGNTINLRSFDEVSMHTNINGALRIVRDLWLEARIKASPADSIELCEHHCLPTIEGNCEDCLRTAVPQGNLVARCRRSARLASRGVMSFPVVDPDFLFDAGPEALDDIDKETELLEYIHEVRSLSLVYDVFTYCNSVDECILYAKTWGKGYEPDANFRPMVFDRHGRITDEFSKVQPCRLVLRSLFSTNLSTTHSELCTCQQAEGISSLAWPTVPLEDIVARYYGLLPNVVGPFRTFLRRHQNEIETIVITYTCVLVFFSAVNYLFPPPKPAKNNQFLPQGVVSGVIEGESGELSVVERVQGIELPWLGRKANCGEVIVHIRRADGDKSVKMFAIFVAHDVILLPRHFFYNLHYDFGSRAEVKDGDIIQLDNGTPFNFVYSEKCRVDIASDACLYVIPHSHSTAKTLYSSFSDSLDGVKSVEAMGKSYLVIGKNASESAWMLAGNPYKMGDCGRPYFYDGKIVGVHVASAEGNAVLMRISERQLKDAFTTLESRGFHPMQFAYDFPKEIAQCIVCEMEDVKCDMSWVRKQTDDAGFFQLDHIPLGGTKMYDTFHSSIRHSSMFEAFGSLCEEYTGPHTGHAIFVDGMWRSPVVARLNTINVDKFDVNLAFGFVDEYIAALPKPDISLDMINFETALKGHPDNPFINAKDDDKSVGPLWGLRKIHRSKVIEKVEEGRFRIDPRFKERVNYIIDSLDKGLIPIILCSSSLKDEAYPKRKSEKGGGRLFYVPEVEWNVVLKMLFANIVAYLYLRPEVSGIWAGINAGSGRWNDLFNWLSSISQKFSDLDGSKYDNHHKTIKLILEYMMFKLSLHLGYSLRSAHLVAKASVVVFQYLLKLEGIWYKCGSRMPSGEWITLLFNSLITLILFGMRCKMFKLVYLKDYRIGATGDDGIYTVLPEFEDKVFDNIQEWYAQMGYTITAGDKSDTIGPRPFGEVSFLKRGFVLDTRFEKEGGTALIVGPLKKESIYKALSYVVGDKKVPLLERDRNAWLCAVKEMWLHGDNDFHNFIAYSRKWGIEWPCKTSDDYLQDYKAGKFFVWKSENDSEFVSSNPPTEEVSFSLVTTPGIVAQSGEAETILIKVTAESQKRGARIEGSCARFNSFSMNNDNQNAINDTQATSLENAPTPVVKLQTVEHEGAPVVKTSLYHSLTNETDRENFFRRPTLIRTVSVTTAAVGFDTFSVFTLYKAINAVNTVLKQYKLFRGDLVLRVVYTGSSGLQGMVRVHANPNSLADDYVTAVTLPTHASGSADFTRSSQYPHLDLSVSLVCSCELSLPFPHQSNYMAIASENDWIVTLDEVNPVASVNGVTPPALTFSIYAYYENVKLANLIPQSDSSSRSFSSYLQYASDIAAKLPFAGLDTVSSVLSVGSKVARYFGFSRLPSEPGMAVVSRRYGNPALMDGQDDMVFHLGTSPYQQIPIDHRYFPMGTPEDTKIKTLLSRWSMLSKDFGAVTNYVADPLALPSGGGTANTQIYPTMLAYVGFAFAYWTGSLEYKLIVRASPLVRWRFMVAIIPPNVAVPGAAPTAGDYLTFVVEVAGETETTFEVPFMYEETWEDCAINDLSSGTTTRTRIAFFSLMSPSGPTATPPQPAINLYVRAGRDFEYAYPSLFNANSLYVAQSKSAESFGEDITDVRYLFRRDVPCMKLDIEGTEVSSNITLSPYPIDPGTVGFYGPTAGNSYSIKEIGWTYDSFLSKLYIGKRGSSRIRCIVKGITGDSPREWMAFMVNATTPGVPQTVEPQLGTFPDIGNGAIFIPRADDQLLELGLPYRSRYKFTTTSLAPMSASWGPGVCVAIMPTLTTDVTWYGRFMYGTGDDFTVGGIMAAPGMKFR